MSDQARPHPPVGPGKRATELAAKALEDARHEAAYVELLITFLAAGPEAAANPAGGVFASLSSGVVLMSEAAALAAALGTAVAAGAGVYVYFDGQGGRQRCVKLNPIARAIAKAQRHGGQTPTDCLRCFLDSLGTSGPALFKSLADNRLAQLAALERGGAAFWSKHLPQLLLQDASGLLTLRPLRPEALARWVAGQPLVAGAPPGPALFAASASMLAAATSIDGSDVIHQVIAIMTAGDGTNLAALRAKQLELLVPLLDEAQGDAPGLLLVTIAAGFCEHGTIQTSRTSHSLTARYSCELGRMFLAMPTLVGSLSRLAPAERRVAYAELLTHGKDPTDAKAALSNADMYLCDATGCDPCRFVAEDVLQAVRLPARYLSAGERRLVAQASPTLAPTPELQATTSAVSAIATAHPVRPGDMPDARFEDLEVHKQRVVLNLRRRAGLKGQKTATAEGPMEFIDPEVVKTLASFKEFRESQGAMKADPLWGRDLEESRRLYTQACAIIDRLSKHASGDAVESFYSLRHGIVSDELLNALMREDPGQAQAAAKRASVKARHRDLRTTAEEYFRFGHEVLHHRATKGLGTLLTSNITAAWSGVRAHALDQRVSRSERSRIETLWDAIGEAVPISAFPSIQDQHPCAPNASQPERTPLKLDDVAFSHVCLQMSFKDGITAWDGRDPAAVAASSWGAALVAARTRYVRQWADAVRPASTRQKKLQWVAKRLRSYPDSAAVKAATRLWRATAKDGFIDVSDPASLQQWLTFLVDAGVPVSRLVLRVDETAVPKLEVINALFAEVTGYRPTIDEVPSGKGRPAVYLMVSSKEPLGKTSPPPRAVEMSGFNALFLAACMREDLIAPQAKE